MGPRIYIFDFFFKKKKIRRQITRRQKAKETKEEKIISAENVTGYDYIVFEFALCTFLTYLIET